MARWHQWSIERKLPAIMTGLLLLVVATFAAASYREVRRVALDAATERLQRVSTQLGTLLGTSTRQMATSMRALAARPTMLGVLRAPGPATEREALDTLRALVTRGQNLYDIELWAPDGRRVLAARGARPALSPALAGRIVRAVPSDSGVLIDSLRVLGDSLEFAVLGTIRVGPGAPPLGFVVERRRLSGSPQGSSQLAALIGSDAEVLIGNGSGDLWTNFYAPVTRPPLATGGTSPLLSYARPDGTDVLARVTPVPGSPWTLLIEFPRGPVLAGPNRYLVRAIGLAVVLMIGGVVSGWWMSRRITRRLRAVTETSEAIARTEPQAAPAAAGADEIDRLATSFQLMADRIAQSRRGLEAALQRYRLLFEENPLPMWVFDQETLAFLDVNTAAVRSYGYSREEFLRMTIADIRPPEDRERLRAALGTAPGGLAATGVWRHRRKDGSVLDVEVTRHRITLDGRPVSLAAAHDVTARRAAERALRDSEDALRRLNAELEQRVAERTAALTAANRELEAFSYSVSHDLRAPLRAIDGFSRLLNEEHAAELTPEARRLLGVVRTNTQQMGNLIDDLLAFARLGRQSLSLQPVDMTALAQAVSEEVQRGAADTAQVVIHPLPASHGDRAMLRQVFLNLLQNGIKFSRGRSPAQVEVGHRTVDGVPTYFVRDNGVGYDPRYADKLFGVFQRLHRAEDFEGTGVGLAIVHRIVMRHGGRVWAEGALNQGATFYFTLPAASLPEPDAEPARG